MYALPHNSSKIKNALVSCQENLDSFNRHDTPLSSVIRQVVEMESITGIDTKCIDPEFSYLEYMQPSRRKPTYWNNLGSSKNRTTEQAQSAKDMVSQMISEVPADTVVAFTDGSCRGNPGPCGAGACLFLPNGDCLEIKRPVSRNSSILVGELVAIKITLESTLEEHEKRPVRRVNIFSDSQTAVGILTLGWDCNGHQALVHEITSQC